MAPGGAVTCECAGSGFTAGVTSLDFLREMKVAVPDVFTRLDGFASHAYPAEGEGWGFFVPYDRAATGLNYFGRELDTIGVSLPVFITETGWTADGDGSRDDHATWTVQAYQDLWLTDGRIHAVMPFMLQDGGWESFAWVSSGGAPYPVYNAVRNLRCTMISGRCP